MDNYEELEQRALERYYELSAASFGCSPAIPVENGKITYDIDSSIFSLADMQYHNFTGFILGVENGKLTEESFRAVEELIPGILDDMYKNREELLESYMSKAKIYNEGEFLKYEHMLKTILNNYNLYTQACNEFGIQPKEMYTFKALNSKGK